MSYVEAAGMIYWDIDHIVDIGGLEFDLWEIEIMEVGGASMHFFFLLLVIKSHKEMYSKTNVVFFGFFYLNT